MAGREKKLSSQPSPGVPVVSKGKPVGKVGRPRKIHRGSTSLGSPSGLKQSPRALALKKQLLKKRQSLPNNKRPYAMRSEPPIRTLRNGKQQRQSLKMGGLDSKRANSLKDAANLINNSSIPADSVDVAFYDNCISLDKSMEWLKESRERMTAEKQLLSLQARRTKKSIIPGQNIDLKSIPNLLSPKVLKAKLAAKVENAILKSTQTEEPPKKIRLSDIPDTTQMMKNMRKHSLGSTQVTPSSSRGTSPAGKRPSLALTNSKPEKVNGSKPLPIVKLESMDMKKSVFEAAPTKRLSPRLKTEKTVNYRAVKGISILSPMGEKKLSPAENVGSRGSTFKSVNTIKKQKLQDSSTQTTSIKQDGTDLLPVPKEEPIELPKVVKRYKTANNPLGLPPSQKLKPSKVARKTTSGRPSVSSSLSTVTNSKPEGQEIQLQADGTYDTLTKVRTALKKISDMKCEETSPSNSTEVSKNGGVDADSVSLEDREVEDDHTPPPPLEEMSFNSTPKTDKDLSEYDFTSDSESPNKAEEEKEMMRPLPIRKNARMTITPVKSQFIQQMSAAMSAPKINTLASKLQAKLSTSPNGNNNASQEEHPPLRMNASPNKKISPGMIKPSFVKLELPGNKPIFQYPRVTQPSSNLRITSLVPRRRLFKWRLQNLQRSAKSDGIFYNSLRGKMSDLFKRNNALSSNSEKSDATFKTQSAPATPSASKQKSRKNLNKSSCSLDALDKNENMVEAKGEEGNDNTKEQVNQIEEDTNHEMIDSNGVEPVLPVGNSSNEPVFNKTNEDNDCSETGEPTAGEMQSTVEVESSKVLEGEKGVVMLAGEDLSCDGVVEVTDDSQEPILSETSSSENSQQAHINERESVRNDELAFDDDSGELPPLVLEDSFNSQSESPFEKENEENSKESIVPPGKKTDKDDTVEKRPTAEEVDNKNNVDDSSAVRYAAVYNHDEEDLAAKASILGALGLQSKVAISEQAKAPKVPKLRLVFRKRKTGRSTNKDSTSGSKKNYDISQESTSAGQWDALPVDSGGQSELDECRRSLLWYPGMAITNGDLAEPCVSESLGIGVGDGMDPQPTEEVEGGKRTEEKQLVIPEKSSSFAYHPERLCHDVCCYCHNKFGLYDTPLHVAQLKGGEVKQRSVLEREPFLTLESCLCDACFRRLDRPAPLKGPNKTSSTKTRPQGQPCCVHGCSQPARHAVMGRMIRRAVSKLRRFEHFEAKPGSYLCSDHYLRIMQVCSCAMCKRKLSSNQMRPLLDSEFPELNVLLMSDGIPVQLGDHAYLCKKCRYYASIRLRYQNYTQLNTNHIAFLREHRRRILFALHMEPGKSEEIFPDKEAPPKKKKKSTTATNNTLGPLAKDSSSTPSTPISTPITSRTNASSAVSQATSSLTRPSPSVSSSRTTHVNLTSNNTPKIRLKLNSTGKLSSRVAIPSLQTRPSAVAGNDVVIRKISTKVSAASRPPPVSNSYANFNIYESPVPSTSSNQSHSYAPRHHQQQQLIVAPTPVVDITLVVPSKHKSSEKKSPPPSNDFPFAAERNVGMTSEFTFEPPNNDSNKAWQKCAATFQFDKRTHKQWQHLYQPYGNYSSFMRHLVLLETHWRNGDLELAPQASNRAVQYLTSVQNRIQSFEETPVSEPPTVSGPMICDVRSLASSETVWDYNSSTS